MNTEKNSFSMKVYKHIKYEMMRDAETSGGKVYIRSGFSVDKNSKLRLRKLGG
jgi:hypothetical protein